MANLKVAAGISVAAAALTLRQLDQLGEHGAPHGPGDQPAGHTGGRSHVDFVLITKFYDLASSKSFASSTAASAVSLFPESLLDFERPLNLDLVLDLDKDLGQLLLRLLEGDLDRDLEPDEVELLLLDLVSSPSSMSIICTD